MPVWATCGFFLGATLGAVAGYLIAEATEKGDSVLCLLVSGSIAGGGAAGGAVIGAVRDVLSHFEHRYGNPAGLAADYREPS
jgi:hypothetical protein